MLAMLLALVLAAPPVDAGLRGDLVGEVQGAPAVDFAGWPPSPGSQAPDGRGGDGRALPPEARVRIGKVEVEGPLSIEVARRVLAVNRGHLRYCYEVALRRVPALQGRLTLRLKVDPAGTVATAEVADSTLNEERVLEPCVEKRAARWRFPTFPAGQVGIRAAVTFTLE